MEKKRLSLLSGFMGVTAKGTENKQRKEVDCGVRAGGGGSMQRGEKLLLFALSSSILVELFPCTCIVLVDFF